MFTRREKIVLGIFGAAFAAVTLIVLLAPNLLDGIAEFIYLIVVIIPVGWLLATDPDRIKKNGDANKPKNGQ